MLTNESFALLIGIDDYSVYDASVGQPRGTSDLPGSVQDVRAFWRICRHIGVRPERMRVLTSPRIDPAELAGAKGDNVGEATRDAILEGVTWISEKLAAPPRPAGLIAYSGHGDWLEGEGLVICPSDTVGPNLEHSILMKHLQRIIREREAGENLTLVLDTCHAGGAKLEARRASSLTGRPLPAALLGALPAVSDRILAASEVGGTAYQARFSGLWQGVFSFVLGALLDQWKAVQDGPSVRFNVSYGDLLDRAKALLDVLSFQQTPVLSGTPNVASLAVLQRGLVPQETSRTPDAPSHGEQLDPGIKDYVQYDLTYQNGATSYPGVTIASKTAHEYSSTYAFSATQEYWSIPSGLLTGLQSPATGSTFRIAGSGSLDWPESQPTSFPDPGNTATANMPTSVSSWSQTSPSGSVWYWTNGSGNGTATSGMAIDFSGLSFSDNTWSGSLVWYTINNATPTGPVVSSTVSESLSYGSVPAPKAGYSWYKATIAVSGTVSFT
jgi:hypothetical protein